MLVQGPIIQIPIESDAESQDYYLNLNLKQVQKITRVEKE